MAIDPPSDVVLEVAKAADPTRAAAAAQRLNALGGAGAANAADFATTLAQTTPTASPAAALAVDAGNARARFVDAASAASDKEAKTRTDFEAMVLNGFVKEMLPKNDSAVYGEGLAGDMWKSMLADQVSKQIAKSGTLGIANRLFSTHSMAAADSLGKASRLDLSNLHDAAQMSGNALSLPSAASTTDGSFLFADRKRS